MYEEMGATQEPIRRELIDSGPTMGKEEYRPSRQELLRDYGMRYLNNNKN